MLAVDSKGGMGDANGDFVRLPMSYDEELEAQLPLSNGKWVSLLWWTKVVFLCIVLGAAAAVLVIFAGPLVIKKKWLERWPNKSAILRLAGEGDWFHQFRAVTLIRVSPFPYIVFNYASVATNVQYCPYICGSMVGIVPDIFITIYSGRLLRNLADATDHGDFLSLQQVIYDVLGFSVALATTVAITIYAKRTLQTLQIEDKIHQNCHPEL
ncbi:uncharacterized protein LOC110019511 isoform X2 [Phalaenopsis equestris]|uniref:uncharacterized protein LOC110019511 isoform X2 n=1 Tax=Phalaenopsis equestris TaxID=78828 RepID=UPI0009E32378|nr:uncharacterized protein LOC110019511 isoform X2 [Phalaenopsis equestris]